MSLPRTLIVASNFPPVRGGSASVYSNLAARLQNAIVVLAPMLDYADGLPLIGWREHDRNATYQIIRIPLLRTILTGLTSRRKWTWRLVDLWIRMRVLVIVLREVMFSNIRCICVGELIASGWLLKILRWMPSMRTTVYIHGEEITTSLLNEHDRRRVKTMLIASDYIIVVSQFTFKITAQLVGEKHAGKIRLIQNGVDIGRFYPASPVETLRADYGIAEDTFIFISVSRLVEKKGHDKAIAALKSVVEEYSNTILLIVGEGPYRETLERISKELELTSSVKFIGSVSEDDLANHYRMGDVFIMPNRALPDGDTEGFGLVFLEANGCGLPVIAGRDGGSLEAVTDGFNGLTVNGNSVQEISEAMMSLRHNAALRASLRANGLERARAFDWSSRADLFFELCNNSR